MWLLPSFKDRNPGKLSCITGDESSSAETTFPFIPVAWMYPTSSADAWEQKHNDILNCLLGQKPNDNDDEDDYYVNLWQLRELALSPGGLLCPQIRKRAWPTLLACPQKVMAQSIGTCTLSHKDLRVMERDISMTVWNIQEHLTASKRHRQLQEEHLRLLMRRVRFAPTATAVDEHSNICVSPTVFGSSSSEDEDSPKNAAPQVAFLAAPPPVQANKTTHSKDEEDDPSLIARDDNTILSQPRDDDTVNTHETTFTLSSRVVPWRKATPKEKKILFNVLSSLLRTEPAPSDYYEDDRYHYSKGMQDVTGVLLINTESPSITSLLLQQLATAHFRDALRPQRTVLDAAVQWTFVPLLETVDPKLFVHLKSKTGMIATIARSWVATWFAQDCTDIRVASRLMDVLLVSHPLAAVYVSVAILTRRRQLLLYQHTYATIRGLAADTLTAEHIEPVIAMTLQHMYVLFCWFVCACRWLYRWVQ